MYINMSLSSPLSPRPLWWGKYVSRSSGQTLSRSLVNDGEHRLVLISRDEDLLGSRFMFFPRPSMVRVGGRLAVLAST